MAKTKRIRFVADTHVGSFWGLMPPGFVFDGQPYGQNRYQEWLWYNWNRMVEEAPPCDVLFVDGDVIDGQQRKSSGTGIITTDPDIQIAAAKLCYAPLVAKAPKWYLLRGTPYHETMFENFAETLGAEKWPSGARHGWVLDIEIGGLVFNIAHHLSSGSAIYKGTLMDREILWSIISAALAKVPHADILVRAHNHFYAAFEANSRCSVMLPCWQLITPYAIKLAYFRYQPDIGYVDILVTGDPERPFIIERTLYPLPPKAIVTLDGEVHGEPEAAGDRGERETGVGWMSDRGPDPDVVG